MKSIHTILLIIASCQMALAQNKHNIYVDAGINRLGIAATYDRKLTRHFDIGLGVNVYDFRDASYAKIRSACYLDLRPYWVIKRSLLFGFADVGAAYNGGRMPDSMSITHVGFYSALGLGYHYRINKRGMGPYVSAGLYGYFENEHSSFAYLPQRARDYGVLDVTLIYSLGFKF